MHTFVGELSRDPEITIDETAGRARVNLSVKVVDRWRDDKGQWQTKAPVVWDCWVWAERAKAVARAGLTKGVTVIVRGKFRTSVWTNAYGDEQRRTVFDIFHLGIDLTRQEAPDRRREPAEPAEGRDTTHAWDTTPAEA